MSAPYSRRTKAAITIALALLSWAVLFAAILLIGDVLA